MDINNTMQKVNRVEVIDENGRSYVKYLNDSSSVEMVLQDDERTLKIFIKKKSMRNKNENKYKI